ncbi:MAG: C-terminal binding protein [Alphaproteobacteria bacterium]|nr:C-terminal binding protein [Alphaproteobacteria bacterium]
MRIVRTDRELECPIVDAHFRAAGAELVLLPDGVSRGELIEAVREADLLLMCYTAIDRAVIEAAGRLKGIVKYGVGIDAIDIDAAIDGAVPVVNIPEYAEQTVAEAAFAMMIALSRRLLPMDRAMRREGWLWPVSRWLGNDIAGKTVGLIGAGRIGRAMARMAGAGFGARVIGYDPHLPEETMRRHGIEPCTDLRALMAASHFVSLHCVLNEETRGIVGAAEIAAMRPDACLINVSRGALIDEMALLAALREGRIRGAALDVFAKEPLALQGHPLSALFGMENVILMPHLAFYTEEAMERLERETLERCRELLSGGPVLVKSHDPRLRRQRKGVRFAD